MGKSLWLIRIINNKKINKIKEIISNKHMKDWKNIWLLKGFNKIMKLDNKHNNYKLKVKSVIFY
jgi:hypothetical protein